jgi:hypothetical protein
MAMGAKLKSGKASVTDHSDEQSGISLNYNSANRDLPWRRGGENKKMNSIPRFSG